MAENASVSSRWNINRGLTRLFVVFSLCWYLAAALVLWPRWSGAIQAQREADLVGSVDEFMRAQNPSAPKPSVDDSVTATLEKEKAMDAARAQRPIVLTVVFLVTPGIIYLLAVAGVWIVRGFHAKPTV